MNGTRYAQSIIRSAQRRAWPTPVTEPPLFKVLDSDTGIERTEELLLTGSFVWDDDDWLRNHQIGLSYASYNPQTCRFERCLLSYENYKVLTELQLEGKFETPFYVTWSLGELYYREQLAANQTTPGKRPTLPEWAYTVHPTPLERQALERWLESHSLQLKVLQGGKTDSST